MDTSLLKVISAFEHVKVLVIGEAMLDTYLQGPTSRLCREAPVPVVSVTERENLPGGAANTAVNLHRLGGEVFFLSVLGDDLEGRLLRDSLKEFGVSTQDILTDPTRQTLAKQRVIADSQMVVRFDQGSTDLLSGPVEDQLIRRLEERFQDSDAVIISDYDYGVLTPRLVETLARLQAEDPRLVVVDSKRLPIYRSIHITAIKPNYQEAMDLLGLPKKEHSGERVDQVLMHGERLLDMSGAQIAAITMDNEGALVFERGAPPYRTYAQPEPNSRAAGAGDTFVSALALSLAAGAQTENAAEIASAAASIVVHKDGTSSCSIDELIAFFSTGEKFVTDVFQLAARMAAYRESGKRVVFTNGCFDILHRGHINYLNRAKAFGDILIIGINSDASVSRLKGTGRPINSLEDRAQVLAAMSCVDLIVPFNSDTPHELIRLVKPDVFVKGGDYTRETLPEAALVEQMGGAVEIMPYLANHSTTSIIERIRQLEAESAAARMMLGRETK